MQSLLRFNSGSQFSLTILSQRRNLYVYVHQKGMESVVLFSLTSNLIALNYTLLVVMG